MKADEIVEIEEEIDNDRLVSFQAISEDTVDIEKLEEQAELLEEKVETLEDEEFEKLKDLYKKDTGKRPIYARKNTKDFSQWLDKLVKESQELVEQIREEEEE
ncbi:MAG: hypothetical protein ACTSR7_03020, partial [Promethearchaeota archaeon]